MTKLYAYPGDTPVYEACLDESCPGMRPGSVHFHLAAVERANGETEVVSERYTVRYPDVEVNVPDPPWGFMVAGLAAMAMREAEVSEDDIEAYWAELFDTENQAEMMGTIKRWVTLNDG